MKKLLKLNEDEMQAIVAVMRTIRLFSEHKTTGALQEYILKEEFAHRAEGKLYWSKPMLKLFKQIEKKFQEQLNSHPEIMEKVFDNVDRDRYYGLRVGDTVNLRGLDGKALYVNAEVINYGFMDNNRVTVRLANGNETNWVAEWCEIIIKVEDKDIKIKNN